MFYYFRIKYQFNLLNIYYSLIKKIVYHTFEIQSKFNFVPMVGIIDKKLDIYIICMYLPKSIFFTYLTVYKKKTLSMCKLTYS